MTVGWLKPLQPNIADIDFRGFAADQIGGDFAGAGAHGPAESAVSGI